MTNDKLLIEQVISGDTKAFRQLVEIHHKRVIHICLSFTAIPSDAEDVAQEVFIEVFKSIEGYRGDASLSTWLYRLSVNKSLDFIRQKKRQKRGSGLIITVEQSDLENIQVSSKQLPSDNIEEEERRMMLYKAIDQLPERQKVAVLLSKIEELAQQEVADIMKTSVSSVESLLVRAKKKLKEILLKEKEEIY